jgi:hypothetical protein
MISAIMKKKAFVFLFIFYTSVSFAQTWAPLSTGLDSPSTWPFPYVGFRSIASYNGEVYVGGNFTSVGGISVRNIARWNGSNWFPLDSGTNGEVDNMLVYNGQLYVSGSFTTAGNLQASGIAKWNGSTWLNADSGMLVCGSSYSSVVFNNELYVCGGFDSIGSVAANHIAKWNGTSWSQAGTGHNGFFVSSLAVYNNELYACGPFFLSKFDGTNWPDINVGPGSHADDIIRTMIVYDGKLIVSGEFNSIGNTQAGNIAAFDGVNFTPLGNGIREFTGDDIGSLQIYNNDLYVAGSFSLSGSLSLNNIARWNGNTWSALGSGLNSYGGSMVSCGGDLYVMGEFDHAGGIPASHIARWNLPIGIDELNSSVAVQVYPNPTIDKIIIESQLPGCKIKIMDITGKILLEDILHLEKSEINVNSFSSGIYILSVSNGEGEFYEKIIKL